MNRREQLKLSILAFMADIPKGVELEDVVFELATEVPDDVRQAVRPKLYLVRGFVPDDLYEGIGIRSEMQARATLYFKDLHQP